MARMKRTEAPKVEGIREHLEAYYARRVARYAALKTSPWHHQLAALRAGRRVIVPGMLIREFLDVDRYCVYEVSECGEVSKSAVDRA